MKPIIFLVMLVALSSCSYKGREGVSLYEQTAPGAALPNMHVNLGRDSHCDHWTDNLQCTSWNPPSDECINPKGMMGSPLVVPCASIKTKKPAQ